MDGLEEVPQFVNQIGVEVLERLLSERFGDEMERSEDVRCNGIRDEDVELLVDPGNDKLEVGDLPFGPPPEHFPANYSFFSGRKLRLGMPSRQGLVHIILLSDLLSIPPQRAL